MGEQCQPFLEIFPCFPGPVAEVGKIGDIGIEDMTLQPMGQIGEQSVGGIRLIILHVTAQGEHLVNQMLMKSLMFLAVGMNAEQLFLGLKMGLGLGKHCLKDIVKNLSLLIGIERLDKRVDQSKKLAMLGVDFLNANTEGIVPMDRFHGYISPIITVR